MPKHKKRKTSHRANDNDNDNDDQLTHEQIWDDSALLRSWNDALAEYRRYHSIFVSGEDVESVLDRAEREGEGGHEVEQQMASRQEDGDAMEDAEVLHDRVDEGENAALEDGEINVEDENLGEGFTRGGDSGRADQRNATRTSTDVDDDSAVYARTDKVDLLTQRKAEVASQINGDAVFDRATIAASASATLPDQSQNQNRSRPAMHDRAVAAQPASAIDPTEQSATQLLENVKMAYYWAGYYSGLYDGRQQQQQQ